MSANPLITIITPTDERIAALRDRAWTLIRDGHITRGLNALDRVNQIALRRASRRVRR